MVFCVCWFQCSQPLRMFSLPLFPFLCTHLPLSHFLTDTQTHMGAYTYSIKSSSLCNLQQLCYRSAAVIVLDIVSFVGSSSCTEVLLIVHSVWCYVCIYVICVLLLCWLFFFYFYFVFIRRIFLCYPAELHRSKAGFVCT